MQLSAFQTEFLVLQIECLLQGLQEWDNFIAGWRRWVGGGGGGSSYRVIQARVRHRHRRCALALCARVCASARYIMVFINVCLCERSNKYVNRVWNIIKRSLAGGEIFFQYTSKNNSKNLHTHTTYPLPQQDSKSTMNHLSLIPNIRSANSSGARRRHRRPSLFYFPKQKMNYSVERVCIECICKKQTAVEFLCVSGSGLCACCDFFISFWTRHFYSRLVI